MDSPAQPRPEPLVPTRGHESILILDFGAQYTQLIARRVREAQVYCEIHPADVTDAFVREFGAQGIILSGSHMSAYEESTETAPAGGVRGCGVPVLGICYGMQTMAQQLGGRVEPGKVREFGLRGGARPRPHEAPRRHRGHPHARRPRAPQGVDEPRRQGDRRCRRASAHGFHRQPARSPAWRTRRGASTACSSIPEVTHTLQGKAHPAALRLRHLRLRAATGTCPTTSPKRSRGSASRSAREEVILGLSGGVDSSVAAALIHKAIGEQLTCVFVDHGLLRLNEAEQVHGHLCAAPAREGRARRRRRTRFSRRSKGVADPEQKRKIIGRLFVDVFQREAAKITNAKWLAQGTIYPDVIESAGAKTKKAIDHQVAPQRRRAARDAASEAPRAAARALQGRGARAGARARAAARDGVPPSVPGAGARRAHPGRGEARIRRAAAARGRHLHRGAARSRLVRARPRRRSRCSCRCARSASWATGAPTSTSSRCAPCRPPTS